MRTLPILVLLVSLPVSAFPKEPFLIATNTYQALVETFCQTYNTRNPGVVLDQMDLQFTKDKSADRFRLQSYMATYTSVSDVHPLPIGSISNAVMVQIGRSPVELPKYPMLYSCRFNGDTEGYLEFHFQVFRGYAATSICMLMIGVANPSESEGNRIMEMTIESDRKSQSAGGAPVSPVLSAE